jgi:hypothetical protein
VPLDLAALGHDGRGVGGFFGAEEVPQSFLQDVRPYLVNVGLAVMKTEDCRRI